MPGPALFTGCRGKCTRPLKVTLPPPLQGCFVCHLQGSRPSSSTCQCQALCGDTSCPGVLPTFLGEPQPDEETEAPSRRSVYGYTMGSGLAGFDPKSGSLQAEPGATT